MGDLSPRTVVAAVVVVLVGALTLLGIAVTATSPDRAQPAAAAAAAAAAPGVAPEKPLVRPVVTRSGQHAVDPAWVRRTATATGIPEPAIDAYGRATLRIGRDQPACHLGWTTLAGVGTIESANGTLGGRRLLSTGYADRPIRGPALNGAGGLAAIEEDGGWSQARGPMQFLVSTWQKWGTDGDGDGRADVDSVYDAALAAARYLCADGHDLATAEGWTAAIFSYNHSADYVRQVYTAATAAASRAAG